MIQGYDSESVPSVQVTLLYISKSDSVSIGAKTSELILGRKYTVSFHIFFRLA